MSVVLRIEKAKLPARLYGRAEERRGPGNVPQMETRPGSGFLGRGGGGGGAAERYANRGSSGGAGGVEGRERVFLGDDGRPSVCQTVIERDKRRRGRKPGPRRVHKSAQTGALKCQLRSSCA